jgi:hypothetical protein
MARVSLILGLLCSIFIAVLGIAFFLNLVLTQLRFYSNNQQINKLTTLLDEVVTPLFKAARFVLVYAKLTFFFI